MIPLSNVLQLLKHAFNYQVYEIFEPLLEPISDLIEKAGGRDTALLALLQIYYEIELCEGERKAALTLKTPSTKKNTREMDKRRQRTRSPSKTKDTPGRKRSPPFGKFKLKKTKAVQSLIDAAKGTRPVPVTEAAQAPVDQTNTGENNDERSLEELLEDLCFLLLTDPQIVSSQSASLLDQIIFSFSFFYSKKKSNLTP